jgi:hypothetical protein
MRTILAALAVLTLASPAAAYCYAPPDSAATGYVANDLSRTLCIQSELANSTALRIQQSQNAALLGRLQRDALQQRLQLQQLQSYELMQSRRFY